MHTFLFTVGSYCLLEKKPFLYTLDMSNKQNANWLFMKLRFSCNQPSGLNQPPEFTFKMWQRQENSGNRGICIAYFILR